MLVSYYDLDRTWRRSRLTGRSWDLSAAFAEKWGPSPWGPCSPRSIHLTEEGLWLLRLREVGTENHRYLQIPNDSVETMLASAGHDVPEDGGLEISLQATLELLRTYRADRSADLVELVAGSPGQRLDIDVAIQALCRVRCEDRKSMAAARVTVNATVRRAIEILDRTKAPLRLERVGRLICLGKP